MGECKIHRIRLNEGQPSTSRLVTLQSPNIVPDLVPPGFIDILLEPTKFLKMVPMTDTLILLKV